MSLRFRAHASSTGFNIRLNGAPELGPNVFSTDEFERAVLSKMSRDRVIMFVLQDSRSKVAYIWNVNAFVQEEESFGVYGPSIGGVVESKRGDGVGWKGLT